MRASYACVALVLFATGCASEEDSNDVATESDLFGVGDTRVTFTAKHGTAGFQAGPAGSPICFELSAYQKTKLFDLSGASDLRGTTRTPYLFMPKGSFFGPEQDRDYVGVGPVCLAEDRYLYISAHEYIPPTRLPENGTQVVGSPIRTEGPEHVFKVGRLAEGVPTDLAHDQQLSEKQAEIFGHFRAAFRTMVAGGSDDTVGNAWPTFVIRARDNLTVPEYTTQRPKLVLSR